MVQTLEKSIQVLNTIAANQPIDVKKLSKLIGIPLPTLYRFIETFEENGFVVRVADNSTYRLGLSLARLGSLALQPYHISDIIHPVLQKVAEQTGESTSLQVRRGMDTLCIDCVESTQRVRFSPQIGRISPLYAGAGPVVLLAYMADADREEYIDRTVLRGIGPKTIKSKDELRKKVKEVIKRGFAVSEEELTEGAVAIAVPVYDVSGLVVASLTANGPKYRMKGKTVLRHVKALKRFAQSLSGHSFPIFDR